MLTRCTDDITKYVKGSVQSLSENENAALVEVHGKECTRLPEKIIVKRGESLILSRSRSSSDSDIRTTFGVTALLSFGCDMASIGMITVVVEMGVKNGRWLEY